MVYHCLLKNDLRMTLSSDMTVLDFGVGRALSRKNLHDLEKSQVERDKVNILELLPCDKAVICTRWSIQYNIFLQNLHEKRIKFLVEQNAFVLDDHHSHHEFMCKPPVQSVSLVFLMWIKLNLRQYCQLSPSSMIIMHGVP